MSLMQRFEMWLEANVWKHFKAVIAANHEYPYHDFVEIVNTMEADGLNGSYAVGTNNVNAHGDQSKRFVSKRANIWTDDGNTTIKFNDSRNVTIVLEPHYYDVGGSIMYYAKEFYTNIAVVYYHLHLGQALRMYFEGVLPEEARDAE